MFSPSEVILARRVSRSISNFWNELSDDVQRATDTIRLRLRPTKAQHRTIEFLLQSIPLSMVESLHSEISRGLATHLILEMRDLIQESRADYKLTSAEFRTLREHCEFQPRDWEALYSISTQEEWRMVVHFLLSESHHRSIADLLIHQRYLATVRRIAVLTD